jgi:hypothetical protein
MPRTSAHMSLGDDSPSRRTSITRFVAVLSLSTIMSVAASRKVGRSPASKTFRIPEPPRFPGVQFDPFVQGHQTGRGPARLLVIAPNVGRLARGLCRRGPGSAGFLVPLHKTTTAGVGQHGGAWVNRLRAGGRQT